MSNRDNKAAAVEFRELVAMDFDEFTRRARVKLLLALVKFAEPIDVRCCNSPTRAIHSFSSSARD